MIKYIKFKLNKIKFKTVYKDEDLHNCMSCHQFIKICFQDVAGLHKEQDAI